MTNKKKSMVINICLLLICTIFICLVLVVILNYKREYNILSICVLFVVFTYYVSVVIHEFAHFFTFIFFKMQMRAICFFPFCFINNGKEWETRINWNNIGLGGATIPNQIMIRNDNDFVRIKKGYGYSMLIATIVSTTVLITGIVFMIISYFFYKNERLIILECFFIIINSIIEIGCFTRSNNASGDFYAYKYLLHDDDIVTMLMYSYVKLSVDYAEIRRNNDYLRKRLIEYFEKKVKENIIDLEVMEVASNLIIEFLIFNISLPNSVIEYINDFYEQNMKFDDIRSSAVFIKFIVVLAYFFEYIGKHEKSSKLYSEYILHFSNSSVEKYRKIQADQIIFHKDNREFLLKRNNIKPDSFYSFYRLFDGYFSDELTLNNQWDNYSERICDSFNHNT